MNITKQDLKVKVSAIQKDLKAFKLMSTIKHISYILRASPFIWRKAKPLIRKKLISKVSIQRVVDWNVKQISGASLKKELLPSRQRQIKPRRNLSVDAIVYDPFSKHLPIKSNTATNIGVMIDNDVFSRSVRSVKQYVGDQLIVSPSQKPGFGSLNFILSHIAFLSDYSEVTILVGESSAMENRSKLIAQTLHLGDCTFYFEGPTFKFAEIHLSPARYKNKGWFWPLVIRDRNDLLLGLIEWTTRSEETDMSLQKIAHEIAIKKWENTKISDTNYGLYSIFANVIFPSDQELRIEHRKPALEFINIGSLENSLSAKAADTSFYTSRYHKVSQRFVTDSWCKSVGATFRTIHKSAHKFGATLIHVPEKIGENQFLSQTPVHLHESPDYDQAKTFAIPPVPLTFLVYGKVSNKARTKTDSPKTSMFMPYFNDHKTVWYSIFSIASQILKVNEIVICDDASDSISTEALHDLKWLYAGLNIRVLKNSSNLGAYPSRNRAITEISNADFISIHDADDYSVNIRTLVQSNNSLPKNSVTYGSMMRISLSGAPQYLKGESDKSTFVSPENAVVPASWVAPKYIRPCMASTSISKTAKNKLGYFLPLRKNADSAYIESAKEYNATTVDDPGDFIHVIAYSDVLCFQLNSVGNLTSDIFTTNSESHLLPFYSYQENPERKKAIQEYRASLFIKKLRARPEILSTDQPRHVAGHVILDLENSAGFEATVYSIAGQVDSIYLWSTTSISKENLLKKHPELSPLAPNLKVEQASTFNESFQPIKGAPAIYHCIFSNDYIYPDNFVDKLYLKSRVYRDEKIISLGGLCLDKGKSSGIPSIIHHIGINDQVDFDKQVDVADCCILFAPSELLSHLSITSTPSLLKEELSKALVECDLEVITISKQNDWLKFRDGVIQTSNTLSTSSEKDFDSQVLIDKYSATKAGSTYKKVNDTQQLNSISYLSSTDYEKKLFSYVPGNEEIHILMNGGNCSEEVIPALESLRQLSWHIPHECLKVFIFVDHSEDDTLDKLRNFVSSSLANNHVEVMAESSQNIGPAQARLRLLNRSRKFSSRRLILLLDMDDIFPQSLGRYLMYVLQKGFEKKFYVGNFSFTPAQAIWPIKYGKTGEPIEALMRIPFNWSHPRIFWDNSQRELDPEYFQINQKNLYYCTDTALFKYLCEDKDFQNYTIERNNLITYNYRRSRGSGTIAKFGSLKKATAEYILSSRR